MTFPVTFLLLFLGGCASVVSVQLTPSPQAPVCQPAGSARVLWAPRWRPDQKDVPAREAAAAEGIRQFFATSDCFATTSVERLDDAAPAAIEARVAQFPGKVVVLVVRELGPVLKLGSSPALVEGGTEVALEVAEYPADRTPARRFSVVWRDGGPGTIKGVATLPKDMQSALIAGLQPARR